MKNEGPDRLEAYRIIEEWVSAKNLTMRLNLSGLNLRTLPPIPDTVTDLSCGNANLEYIADSCIPAKLSIFNCTNSPKLKKLPILPDTVTIINIKESSGITELLQLPTSLKTLLMERTAIRVLPNLHYGLECLTCSYVPIKVLPTLPQTLVMLDVRYTLINTIPELPPFLQYLNCSGTPVKIIPAFPFALRYFECKNCPNLLIKRNVDETLYLYSERWLKWRLEKQTVEITTSLTNNFKEELIEKVWVDANIEN